MGFYMPIKQTQASSGPRDWDSKIAIKPRETAMKAIANVRILKVLICNTCPITIAQNNTIEIAMLMGCSEPLARSN